MGDRKYSRLQIRGVGVCFVGAVVWRLADFPRAVRGDWILENARGGSNCKPPRFTWHCWCWQWRLSLHFLRHTEVCCIRRPRSIAYGMVAVPPGLDAVIAWIGRRRKTWNVPQAQRFFRAGVVALAIFFSSFLYAGGVWIPPGEGATSPLWNARDIEYIEMDRALDARGVPDEVPIITVDPPSFVNRTGRRSIYMPTESVEAIFQAAKQYGAQLSGPPIRQARDSGASCTRARIRFRGLNRSQRLWMRWGDRSPCFKFTR